MIFALALASAMSFATGDLKLRHGEYRSFRIDTAQRDYEIVTAPDRRTEWVPSSGGALLEIDPRNAHVTRHPLHVHETRQPYYPDEMAFDSAGNIWVDNFNNVPSFCGIGEVRHINDVLLHSSPSGDCAVGGIAAAPGRKIWFMEGSHVANISPGGSVQEFPLPTKYSGTYSPVAIGADNNIWFATNEETTPTLYRLNPNTGDIVKIYSFISCYDINTLVLAPDHRLYTACALITNLGSPGAVFAITTSGELSWYSDEDLGYAGGFSGIAVGPDDSLLFPPLAFPGRGLERFSPNLPRDQFYALLDQDAPGGSSVAMGRDGIVWSLGTAYKGRRQQHVAYSYVVAYRL